MNKEKELKEKLIKYNQQDCLALRTLVNFLRALEDESHDIDKYKVSSDFTEEVQRRYSGRKFGNIAGIIDGFEYINERAYFNYQRDKVYFREKRLKKQPKKKRKKVQPKPDSVIVIRETAICPYCKSNKTEISTYGMHTKLVFDLKIRKKGLFKYVLLYKSHAVK